MVALTELHNGESIFFISWIPELLMGSDPAKVVRIEVDDLLHG